MARRSSGPGTSPASCGSNGTSGPGCALEGRPELITLSLYINACTAPTDRVLVQSYLPQVLAIARRAFAGGHADLRPGFFEMEDAQRLTLERLRAPVGADHPARHRGLAPQLLPIVSDRDRLHRPGVSSGGHARVRRPIRHQPVRPQGSHADRDVGATGVAVLRNRHERGTLPDDVLSEPNELDAEQASIVDRVFGRLRAAVRAWRRPLDSELRVLQEEVRELRREMQSRLLQYNHQLGRMARVSRAPTEATRARASGGCPGARFPWTRASTSRRCGKRSVTRSRFRIPKAASG